MNFNDRERTVLDFMDRVKQKRRDEQKENEFKQSSTYKLRELDKQEKKARCDCANMVFAKLYRDAVPLSDDYKVAHKDDLDNEIREFISARAPQGDIEYYVREAIKKGSKPAKDIQESVDRIVNNFYAEKAMDINKWNVEDLVFRTGEDTQQKINAITQDLALDDVTQIIRDNVKSSAISEITRAKKEKQEIEELENELSNDMKVKTEEAIDYRLALAGLTERKVFNPSLFQGIMIGKVNQLTEMQESGTLGSDFLYNTLEDYGMIESTQEPSIEERAFVESVKELTKIQLIKTLCMERFNLQDIRDMALEYAQM